MKKKIILSIFLLILILTGLGVYCINGDKISKNVYVQNINIGDLTKDEAKDKLSSEYKMQSFKFNYKEKTWDIDPKTLDINYDLDNSYFHFTKDKVIINIDTFSEDKEKFKALINIYDKEPKVFIRNIIENSLANEFNDLLRRGKMKDVSNAVTV